MTIDETDQNRLHEEQQSEKLSKHQTEATPKADVPSTKWTKLRKRNVKGYVGPGGGPEFEGPSQAADKSEEYPKRKLK